MTLPCPEAVLFDLDGTLVDSLPTLTSLVDGLLADLGRPALPQATIRTFVGDGGQKLVERALGATGGIPGGDVAPFVATFVARYEAAPVAGTILADGCLECLDAFAANRIALAVCTNKPERVTRLLLAELGLLERFGAIVGGDTCATRKPDKEPALEVCRRLGVDPTRTAFVGDNEHDAACGRAASCSSVVIVSGGYARVPVDELGADRIVDNLAAIPALYGLSAR